MPTVHDLRNEIRLATGRFEREVNAQFTKEELAAVAREVGYPIDAGSRPSKDRMRAGIRRAVGLRDDDDPEAGGGSFAKADLRAIADAVGASEE